MTGSQGRLVIISGPTGVGKSTVCSQLVASGEYQLSISATTRAPRGSEEDGVHYHFLSVEEFKARIDAGAFLEYAVVHGADYYGTPAEPIAACIASGRHALLDIDVQGAQKIKERGLDPVMVFLEPPDHDELLRRLEHRGDTPPEVIARRLKTAEQELAQAWRYDLRVVNDDLERCVAEIRSFVGGGSAG